MSTEQTGHDIEGPLSTAADLLNAIALLALTMGVDHANPVQRLAWLALDQIKIADDMRQRLFAAQSEGKE